MLSNALQRLLTRYGRAAISSNFLIFRRLGHSATPFSPNSCDIIDHGILLWLKCPLVPEKSYISFDNENGDYFTMAMSAPYNCPLQTFLEQLQKCILADEFSLAHITCEIRPPDDDEFNEDHVKMKVPYSFLNEEQICAIENCIYSKHKDIKSYQYYMYCTGRPSYYGSNITAKKIDEVIQSCVSTQQGYHYFFLNENDVWEAIGKYVDSSKKNSSLDNANRDIANTFEHFPCVSIVYNAFNGKKMFIETTRDQIVRLFEPSRIHKGPTKFLISLRESVENKSFKEYKISRKIILLMNEYEDCFNFQKVPDAEKFTMNLTPHFVDKLEKFDVKWTRKSANCSLDTFDRENFHKALLALCHLRQLLPIDERYFQLRYYIHNLRWKEFKELLQFLLTMREKLNIIESYTALGRLLFNYAMRMLEERDLERGEAIFQILYDVLSELKPVIEVEKEDINKVLFDILHAANWEDENGKEDLVEKKFLYSYRGKLPECNMFAAQLYGLPFGERFETNVLEDGLETLMVEIAHKMKLKGQTLSTEIVSAQNQKMEVM